MDKPIAWYDPTNGMVSTDKDSPLFTPLGQVWPLYPQRTWVGLTDEEIAYAYTLEKKFAMQYVDAKLKEKNT
jgi:hypothetical protein